MLVSWFLCFLWMSPIHSSWGRPIANIRRDQSKNLNEGSLAHSSFCFSPHLCLCSSWQRALQAWVQTALSRLHWQAPTTAPLTPVGPSFGRMDLCKSSLMALEMGSGHFSRVPGPWGPRAWMWKVLLVLGSPWLLDLTLGRGPSHRKAWADGPENRSCGTGTLTTLI